MILWWQHPRMWDSALTKSTHPPELPQKGNDHFITDWIWTPFTVFWKVWCEPKAWPRTVPNTRPVSAPALFSPSASLNEKPCERKKRENVNMTPSLNEWLQLGKNLKRAEAKWPGPGRSYHSSLTNKQTWHKESCSVLPQSHYQPINVRSRLNQISFLSRRNTKRKGGTKRVEGDFLPTYMKTKIESKLYVEHNILNILTNNN